MSARAGDGSETTLSLIAAVSENGVIGRGGGLPWHLPADLRRFRALTMGHHIIMGRRTWESVGRPLPGRTTIVLTRREGYRAAGALVAPDLDRALALAAGDPVVFVAGGEAVYRAALPRARRLYLTLVHATVDGDVRFPEIEPGAWTLVEEERHAADERHELPFSFRVYERTASPTGR